MADTAGSPPRRNGPDRASAGSVPTICTFFGIVVRMYFEDHAPPHFHAAYGEFEASVSIDPVGVMRGTLPPRALGLVVEWTRLHQNALLADWERARRHEALDSIPPLE
jgi:hypothetical protein